MAEMPVFVVEDDWGYDGDHLVGVAASLHGAQAFAIAHCAVYDPQRTLPTEWEEITDRLIGTKTLTRQWKSNETNDSGWKFVITELPLMT